MSRPQEKVIGIAKKNLDVEIPQLRRRHRLHSRLRTDGHKNRRFDDTVCRMQAAAPCARFAVLCEDFKLHFSAHLSLAARYRACIRSGSSFTGCALSRLHSLRLIFHWLRAIALAFAPAHLSLAARY